MPLTTRNIVATLIALSIASPVLADSHKDGKHHGKGHHMSFAELDANDDGKVTKDEFDAAHAERFKKHDLNGDGKLDREEMLTKAHKRAESKVDRMIEHMDADKDGALSQEEISQYKGSKMFDKADKNGDGEISQDEFEAMKKHHKRMHKKKHGGESETESKSD